MEEERTTYKPMYPTYSYMQQNPYMMQGMYMNPNTNMMYEYQMEQPMGYPGMMGQMQQPMMGQMDESMGYPMGRNDEEEDFSAEEGYRYRRPYHHYYPYHMYHHYHPYYPYHHGYYHHR